MRKARLVFYFYQHRQGCNARFSAEVGVLRTLRSSLGGYCLCCRRFFYPAKCFQDWHAAIPNYVTEAKEGDHSIIVAQRERTREIENQMGENKPPGFGTVLMFTVQMRKVIRH